MSLTLESCANTRHEQAGFAVLVGGIDVGLGGDADLARWCPVSRSRTRACHRRPSNAWRSGTYFTVSRNGNKMARVVLAMSGGVDSSVAAHLLQQEGHEVVGVFMRHGEQSIASCATSSTAGWQCHGRIRRQYHGRHDRPPRRYQFSTLAPIISRAAAVPATLRMLDEWPISWISPSTPSTFSPSSGRSSTILSTNMCRVGRPTPVLSAINWLKFGKLFDYADSVDAQYVATGHYARCILTEDGTPWLCRGVDHDKDQSYVLFGISQERFQRMLLPVGQFRKAEIRQLATQIGLRVADKRDSQEICFVTSGKHDEFVRARRGDRDTGGKIVTTDGAIVGHHRGIERFTVGQRKGLGVAMGEPYFVVRIDPDTYDVVIGRREQLALPGADGSRHKLAGAPPNRAHSLPRQDPLQLAAGCGHGDAAAREPPAGGVRRTVFRRRTWPGGCVLRRRSRFGRRLDRIAGGNRSPTVNCELHWGPPQFCGSRASCCYLCRGESAIIVMRYTATSDCGSVSRGRGRQICDLFH